jgi:diguanylate cyclase (GGDEF)-like protein
MRSRVARGAVFAGLTAVYFVAAKLCLKMAFLHPSATPVWAPTGIALAAFLVIGAHVWPAIFLGAFLANVTTIGTAFTSAGIATGNTFEAILGASLVTRWAGGLQAFERARDVVKFALLAAVGSTTLAATLGVTSLSLGGFAPWGDYGSIWLTWWLGDAVGALVITPVLVLWRIRPALGWGRRQAVEAAVLVVMLVLAGLVAFGGVLPSEVKSYPLEFLCLPPLLWMAFRFGAREVASAALLLSVIATWGTLHGLGPFAQDTPNESLLLLQAFMGVTSVMSMVVAAVVSERRQVEDRLRELSVRDPLTGLANYRELMDVLEAEIRRSQRTERSFAFLFLDVDGLKDINDRRGHLVGSRALCRVAEALRATCRTVDTPARYGGDEFAVLLPETGEAAALQVARRFSDRLAADPEPPAVSASVGVAVYPRDGQTAEALLGFADRALYQARATRAMKPRP